MLEPRSPRLLTVEPYSSAYFLRIVFQSAFGQSFGEIFLVAAPFAVVALVCVALIREVPLRTSNLETYAEASPEVAAELHHGVVQESRR